MKYILSIIIFVFSFTGCSASVYNLKVVDVQTNEIFLSFSKDDAVKVGDVFVLYTTMQSHSGGGGHQGHGGGSASTMKLVIGHIKVTEIIDATHAKVELISGKIDERAFVERM